jgi:nucleoside-triphosphatase
MKKNILITGLPGSGKTTLLKKVISNYGNKVGFITNEIRKNGERIGFEVETYRGEKAILAGIDFKSDFKVSRYSVNIRNLNSIIPKVTDFNSEAFLYLDEIGRMELFSESFKHLVIEYFDSPNICIATLSKVYSDNFTGQIKNRDDVILVELSEGNRDLQKKYLEALIGKILKAQRYVCEPERFVVKLNDATVTTDHGVRNLRRQENKWICDCGFYKENSICSHLIALEEYLKINN